MEEDEAFKELEERLNRKNTFPSEWKRTCELRFIKKGYSNVLQQKWVRDNEMQWRDVE